eukprot:scaffold4052_cov213-Amphora_coffeaeformis.AAC.12
MNAVRKWFKKRTKENHLSRQRQSVKDCSTTAPLPDTPEAQQRQLQLQLQQQQPQQQDDVVNTVTERIVMQHQQQQQRRQHNHNDDIYEDEHDIASSNPPRSCWSCICCRHWFSSSAATTTTTTNLKHFMTRMETLTDTAPGTPLSAAGSISQSQLQTEIIATEQTPLLLLPQLPQEVKYDNHNALLHDSTIHDDQEMVTTDDNDMMVVLIMDLSVRRFELVALPRQTTVGQVLSGLPDAIQEEQLQALTFTGLMPIHAKDLHYYFNTNTDNHNANPKKALTAKRPRTYTLAARHKLPTTTNNNNAMPLLWVALTPRLTAAQGRQHAQQLLQNPIVQATLKLNGVDMSGWPEESK